MRLKKDNVERIAVSGDEIHKLTKAGFQEIEKTQGNEVVHEEKNSEELSDMPVSKLRNLAKKKGVEAASSLNKAELLELLKDVI